MKAHIVSHTHWDREWYKPFQHFRVRLVFLMERLMDMLENNPDYKSFMLDGQTSLLEDYLSIRPEMEQRLKKLINEGRIIIGPWYTQPDEFVPDGESLIRNLLIGDRISRKYGRPMKIGYLPDSFGQCSQMPQILHGFDIMAAAIWRGVPFSQLTGSEFIWKGLNGSEILAVYLVSGYGSGMFIPRDQELADRRMVPAVNTIKKYAVTGNFLVLNGTDHQWPQQHMVEYIQHLNQTGHETRYEHSSLEEYAAAVKEAAASLQEFSGELIAPEKGRVHTSIVSSRIYQKQQNRKIELFLEKYVEPVCAIGWINGAVYPGNLINEAWRYLLQNQAHDSIGGCCTDQVHREIDQRFIDAENIGDTLVKGYSRAIARLNREDELKLIVFNNSMTQGRQLIKATLYLDNENFRLINSDGKVVPCQINRVSTVNAASLGIWLAALNLQEDKKKVEISFYDDFDFNLGYKMFRIEEGKEKLLNRQKDEIKINGRTVETKFHIINIQKNGSLKVLDKNSGRIYEDLLLFEDCGDAGDTYDYSPVANDVVITSYNATAEIRTVETGAIYSTIEIALSLKVPAKLENGDAVRSIEMIDLPIKTSMTVYSDINRIDFKTEVINNACDHRLRVLFPSSVQTSTSFAEVQFGTLERPNHVEYTNWEKENWSQKPVPIYAQQKFVDVNDGQYGLAILNKGLPEYEIYNDGMSTIAITLFRGVGYMGKRELLNRPGRPSGIEMPTPDAQCLGIRIAEYSLVTHKGNWDEAKIPFKAVEFNTSPLAVQSKINFNSLPRDVDLYDIETLTKHISNTIGLQPESDYGLFRVTNENLLISTVKKAEDDEMLIIRLYNSGSMTVVGSPIAFTSRNLVRVTLTDFDEMTDNGQLNVVDNNTFILPDVSPYTAITLKVSF